MSSSVPATAQDDIITVGEAPQIEATLMDKAFGTGDLKALQPRERVNMYLALCESIGLNPLSRPFEYISMKGKLVLYFKATGAEQLRVIHGVDVRIVSREMLDSFYIVTATATLPSGRTDEAQGIVVMDGLNKLDKANAMMKCETKAKRRVTLSILGMSFLEDVYAKPKDTSTAVVVHVDQATGEITNQASIDAQEKRDNAIPAAMVNRRLSKTMASTPAPPPIDEPKVTNGGGDPKARWAAFITKLSLEPNIGLTEPTIRKKLGDLSQYKTLKQARAVIETWVNESAAQEDEEEDLLGPEEIYEEMKDQAAEQQATLV